MSSAAVQAPLKLADRDSRHSAQVLSLCLPSDVVLYLLLPMYAADFGVTLVQAGILLAANRLVRIIGYGWVVRFYAATVTARPAASPPSPPPCVHWATRC